ncbi:MAG: hypothetical protein EP319_05620 [Deltaproteobacteria bacterium]|nr:MAG: hypothetical protein EP319_05620 [Deltaproteobacteria bacterium]
MVLIQSLILFTFLLFPSLTWAGPIQEMETFLLKAQYEAALDVYEENEDGLKKNERARFLQVSALEGQGEIDEAIEVLEELLKTKYGRQNRNVVQALYQYGEKPIVPDGSQLSVVYYKLAQLYSKKYLETHEATEQKERDKLRRKSFAYLKVAKALSEDSEALETLRDRITERKDYYHSLQYEGSFYVFLSYISWQDHVNLVQTSNNNKVRLLNTSSGSCSGLGRKWENVSFEFFFDACYIMGKSTVSSIVPSVTHKQNNVAVTGFYGGPGVYWKGLADNVSAGFQIPIMKRSGDWDPPNSAYTVDENSSIRAGISIQTKWRMKYVSLAAKLGKVFGNKSSVFNLATIYEF